MIKLNLTFSEAVEVSPGSAGGTISVLVLQTGIPVYQITGSGGAVQHTFSFGDVAQSVLVTTSINSVVLRVDVIITTPFNGSGFNLTVGDAGDNARLFSDIDMTIAATYSTTPGHKYLTSTPINSYLTVDNTTTQGSGLILVYISE